MDSCRQGNNTLVLKNGMCVIEVKVYLDVCMMDYPSANMTYTILQNYTNMVANIYGIKTVKFVVVVLLLLSLLFMFLSPKIAHPLFVFRQAVCPNTLKYRSYDHTRKKNKLFVLIDEEDIHTSSKHYEGDGYIFYFELLITSS